MARTASQSGALPMRLGSRIARVFGEMSSSMRATSVLNVSGSTSTNTGTRPARTSDEMSVENVSVDVMTSEPAGRSSSSTARYSADEPEFTITPDDLPYNAATWRSISATFLPIAKLVTPPSRTSITASFSAWSCTLPEYRTRFVIGLPFSCGSGLADLVWPIWCNGTTLSRSTLPLEARPWRPARSELTGPCSRWWAWGATTSACASTKSRRTVVHAALDDGITHFDTAEMYGGGKSEEFLATRSAPVATRS